MCILKAAGGSHISVFGGETSHLHPQNKQEGNPAISTLIYHLTARCHGYHTSTPLTCCNLPQHPPLVVYLIQPVWTWSHNPPPYNSLFIPTIVVTHQRHPPVATFLKIRLMILPLRVLGRAGAQWMVSGAAKGPIALHTKKMNKTSK
jgi:hypothetical protein